ncbi:MAG: hypothetical protein Q7S22_05930 [Candidatus Micrarchaeota archaeon]|nr:hypothetical protein [Candidatus Micrarchaeota archaeon]
MSSKKIIFLLMLLLGFVYATSVSVSSIESPKTVKQNTTNILINITTNYNFDDSGCFRTKVYLKDTTTQINAPNVECPIGSVVGSKKWTTKLPDNLFVDAGTVSFTYIVEYLTADTGDYIRCSTVNKCTGQIDITVASNAPPAPPPPVVNNSNNNSNSNNGNSNTQNNSSGSTNPPIQNNSALLTADEIRALLNAQQNSSSSQTVNVNATNSSGFDISSVTSNSLFVPVAGSCCCITLLIILVVGGVVGYKRFKKPKMPKNRKKIIDVEIDEEEQQ